MSKTTETKIFKRLTAVTGDAYGDKRQIIQKLQEREECLTGKCRIAEDFSVEKNGGKTAVSPDDRKKHPAVKDKVLNRFLLREFFSSSGSIRAGYCRYSANNRHMHGGECNSFRRYCCTFCGERFSGVSSGTAHSEKSISSGFRIVC